MNPLDTALLVNWLGFSVGIALYLMLGVMVVRHRGSRASRGARHLLLMTALLGLIWNAGELFLFVLNDFAAGISFPLVSAAAYAALGFLPSVVVHSAQNEQGGWRVLTFAAYLLSTAAGVMHFRAAFVFGTAPSDGALTLLTIGAVSLAAVLPVFYFRNTIEKKAVWASALLIFAVSSLHLVGEREGTSWIVELVAHQSSLPLALVILYQNYRFAFADLFLKRAISIMLLALVAFASYAWIAAPMLRYHETHDRDDALAVGLILVLWMSTALIYPALHRLAVWLVDTVILRRADYDEMQVGLRRKIETLQTSDQILDAVCDSLAEVLTADMAEWGEKEGSEQLTALNTVSFTPDSAEIFIPTANRPHYKIDLAEFHGGRRLLSDETAMLEATALFTARRIDALRVDHERCELEFREQRFAKLAAEAKLTALRAQINPHFLFNALTTIGYLIQASPDKAFQTLLQLTKLLRGVLSKTAEFCTLGDEIKLIENYLEIERARFEERLEVSIDVPDELRKVKIPALILQPLVENAIKHGVAENRQGGHVKISAVKRGLNGGTIELVVTDPGSGRPAKSKPETGGVGIGNVRERLRTYYGDRAAFSLEMPGDGVTRATISIPLADKVVEKQTAAEVTEP